MRPQQHRKGGVLVAGHRLANTSAVAHTQSAGAGHTVVSIPCPVCGSHNLQLTLDLQHQPLANDFYKTTQESLSCERHPLQLVRCRTCNHLHLSQLVSRKRLFSDYLYVSGTSATLQKHFEWLATHIAAAVERERPLHGGGGRREEGASSYRRRTVLELACNDGSQLDAFKRLGWRTYGVDPAANIVPTAVAKGHHVKVGFWGAQDVWPPADEPAIELDAIVAQNVLAHVPSPVNFLRDCAKAMGRHTLLYIQTSQCHMHEEGQFDTAYHEHLSFFTAHSFRKAADLAGLNVTGWQVVPIHGQSCLVTFKKLHHVNGGGGQSSSSDALHLALQPRLQEEAQLGLLDDLFYEKYQARAGVTASWIEKQLEQLRVAGYRLGGYGAAAKGMVLLHFLLGRGKAASHLEFVVDDAPMKQGTYCPGTTIPVKPLAHVSSILADDPHTPLALVVFAWNFWPEIALRLQASLKSNRRIIAILPFPTPHVVTLNGRVLSNMSYHTAELGDALQLGVPLDAAAAVAPVAPGSIAPRRRTMLISHFYNEAMLLPFWIAHHAPLFDHAILIDCNSTDGSAELVRKLAPPSWTVIPSSTVSQFGARTLDAQVEQQERLFPNDWHLALTVTEFLIHPRFRETLATFDAGLPKAKHDKAYPKIRALPMLPTVGDDSRSPLRRFESLPIQRSMYLWEKAWNPRTFARHINGGNPPWRRYMHTGEIKGAIYEAGRHGITPAYSSRIVPHMDGFVMKYTGSPWPESMMRHMQTGHNISEDDRKQGLGNQHLNGMDYTKLNGNHISPLHSQDIRVHDLREVLDPSDRAPPEMVKWHSLFREHLDPPHPLFPPALTKTKRDVNVMEGHHHTSPTNFREAFVPYSVSIEPQPPVVSGRDHNHNHHRDWPRATAARDHPTDMAAANSEAVPAGGREALPGEAAEGDAAALARGRQWGLLYVLGACALLPLSVSISLFCRRLGIVYTRLPPPQTKTTSEATSVTAKAEGRVEGDSSSRLARFLFAAGVVCTFICLNSALSILNRWALGVAGGLHIPLLMTASHMIFGAFALAPLMILHDGYARTLLAEARSRARALVLIALMNALQIGLNNASLVCIELSLNQARALLRKPPQPPAPHTRPTPSLCSSLNGCPLLKLPSSAHTLDVRPAALPLPPPVALPLAVQVVRAIGPVVTSALLVCLEGKVPDHREAVCLLLISGGAATTVYSGFGSSTAVGVGLTASSTLAQCLQISISGRIMQGRGQQLGKLDAFQMTALTGPLAFVALLPFALYYEFGVFSAALAMQRARVLGFLLGSCLLAVAYNVTLFQALATLSTIGASILGNVKIVLLLLLSALILGELRTWSVVQLVGCTLTFVASGWYSWHVATKRTE